MIQLKNQTIPGLYNKPIAFDLFYEETEAPLPLVIFSHGFKGFKDFGVFDLIAQRFASAGFCFCKFNFSYNGTTPENPTEFVDLEAFGNNNFSIELDDLEQMIHHLTTKQHNSLKIDTTQISLIGHSRGGGISILKAAEHHQIKNIITWASVSAFGRYWDDEIMKKWQKEGVMYVHNGRTKQQMPMYYQSYEDFYQNADRLDIPKAAASIKQPFLIVHGTEDPTVPYAAALELKKQNPNAELLTIQGANHVFGWKHPWVNNQLPVDCELVVEHSIDFLRKNR